MLNVEGSFHIFIPRFNRLTFVVMIKPDGQAGEETVVAVLDQRSIFVLESHFEAFDGYS